MTQVALSEQYGLHRSGYVYKGEIEFEIRDITGRVLERIREPNLIKIFAKEILAHRLPYSKVWDPNAGTGSGAWVTHNIDLDEFAAKYVILGASYDENGAPLGATDANFYMMDQISGGNVPISLGTGAEYDGGLINAIPIAEPTRPLKRIERIYFEPSYQPAGTPLLQEDVRAINNVVVLETTLRKDEYNGFGVTASDFFTLTEVALVGAAEVEFVGACECNPRDIFLTGNSADSPFVATASGTATISLDSAESDVDSIKDGDQIKIIAAGSTAGDDQILDQVTPYYLVINKALGGRDITLDRTPVDSSGAVLTGTIGVLRDGFKIFSHRVLMSPVNKNVETEIVIRWRIILN